MNDTSRVGLLVLLDEDRCDGGTFLGRREYTHSPLRRQTHVLEYCRAHINTSANDSSLNVGTHTKRIADAEQEAELDQDDGKQMRSLGLRKANEKEKQMRMKEDEEGLERND